MMLLLMMMIIIMMMMNIVVTSSLVVSNLTSLLCIIIITQQQHTKKKFNNPIDTFMQKIFMTYVAFIVSVVECNGVEKGGGFRRNTVSSAIMRNATQRGESRDSCV